MPHAYYTSNPDSKSPARDGEPRRLADLGAPDPPLPALCDFRMNSFGDVHSARKLLKEVQAPNASQGDEGAGVEDENHCCAGARFRRESRSRRRSSGE